MVRSRVLGRVLVPHDCSAVPETDLKYRYSLDPSDLLEPVLPERWAGAWGFLPPPLIPLVGH